MVLKIQPITVIDRLEYLMSKKRYEEAILLISQTKENVPFEEIVKVQNGYLESLLKGKDYDKLPKLLSEFLCKYLHIFNHY
jgi:hypothetical protein